MKDLLKDFTFKKVLKQLSDEGIDALLTKKGNVKQENLVSIRKAGKNKTAILEAITSIIRDNPDCIRVLRIAYFFHKNRSAFIGLRTYLINKEISVDWDRVSAAKSVAEQAVLLSMEHADHVADYFIICIHTHQGKTYCSCRNDYLNSHTAGHPTADALKQLSNQLLEGLKDERGSRYCGARSFEHDGKIFLMLEFDDLPSHQREFEDGKDQAEDKFRRLALDLVYVFDAKNKTVEVIAETPELRLIMHRICASVVYGQEEIVARPPKNEIFDLEKLFAYTIDGRPLAVVETKSSVMRAFVDAVRIRRSKPPYWEIALSLRIPANHAELETDWVKDIQNLVKSVVNVREELGGWWHKSYVQATHADLIIVFWDDLEKKEISKKVAVNSSGGTNLNHSDEDENIKLFLKECGLLKESLNEDLTSQKIIDDVDEKVDETVA